MASIAARLPRSVLLTALLAVLACGDDGMAETSAEGSTSPNATNDTTATATATTTAPTSTTEPTSVTSPLDDTTATTTSADSEGTSGSTTRTDGTSSSGEGSDASSSTGDQGNVIYAAVAVPGGLDRIRITKANLDADRCTWVVLVAPPIADPYPGLTIPAGWSVESISINDVAAACDSDTPAMFGGEPALDAMGTIGFGMLGGTGIYPCTVDIDATFDFQGILPGIPPTDAMIASDIPVTGC